MWKRKEAQIHWYKKPYDDDSNWNDIFKSSFMTTTIVILMRVDMMAMSQWWDEMIF